MTAFRWCPFNSFAGPLNMAVDDVLLRAAATGIPSLRVYGWKCATLSLGYFQPAALRLEHPHIAALPWLRRSSGGGALVHHHELTYALALPAGFEACWMPRMHRRVILPALARLGLADQVEIVCGTALESRPTNQVGGDTVLCAAPPFLCFEKQTPGDLTCHGHKIVGSAQRKSNHCLLQHGAILLARSEFAPALPGIQELTGIELDVAEFQDALLAEFCRETGWRKEMASELTPMEWAKVRETARARYANVTWNEKR